MNDDDVVNLEVVPAVDLEILREYIRELEEHLQKTQDIVMDMSSKMVNHHTCDERIRELESSRAIAYDTIIKNEARIQKAREILKQVYLPGCHEGTDPLLQIQRALDVLEGK